MAFSCCPRIVTGAICSSTLIQRSASSGGSHVSGGTGQNWLGSPGSQLIRGENWERKGSSGGGKVKDGSPERITCSEDDTGLEPFYSLENRKTALLMSLLCTHSSEIQ